ncbi:MAG: response regulator [Elainellaceae cyanobacterium]
MLTKVILLIDDEANVREIVHACLTDLGGWDVVSVASMQEGLAFLTTTQPDAILLDIVSPQADGVSFLETLKQHTLLASIPVMLLTAKARWFTSQQLEQLGAKGAIAKPFNPVMLPQQLAQTFGWDVENQPNQMSEQTCSVGLSD